MGLRISEPVTTMVSPAAGASAAWGASCAMAALAISDAPRIAGAALARSSALFENVFTVQSLALEVGRWPATLMHLQGDMVPDSDPPIWIGGNCAGRTAL